MKHIFGIISCVMFFSFSHLAQAQSKIGHVNMQELVQSLPDYKTAETTLQGFAGDLQKTDAAMQQEYQDKVTKYLKDSASMTQPMKEAKRQDIEDLAKRIQTFESGSGTKTARQANGIAEAYAGKVMTGIKTVAKESGYSYIFDTSNGSALVYYPEQEDLTDIVKKKIGGSGGQSTGQKAPTPPKK